MKKMTIIILFFVIIVFASQWQVPSCTNILISDPSFRSDNLRIYASIYYSIYHSDICYYDWNGSQWFYIDRVPGDVNTEEGESEPFITYDGQKLYYMRSISGAIPPYRLWVATWNGVGFDNSVELNSLINSDDCRYPSITQNGSKLFFSRAIPIYGLKIFEATWDGSDWINPVMLPQEVNGNDSQNKHNVTISPDGNEIYFTGALPYPLRIAFSMKVGGVWQQWQYCDTNINLPGCTLGSEALTYAPYETQELYFARTNSPGTLTWHALRSPVAVEPASLGQIKANYAK